MNENYRLIKRSPNLNYLNDFKKNIEKCFFAKADISPDFTKSKPYSHLIINLNCNFKLIDCLYHINSGNWGGFTRKATELQYLDIKKSLQDLNYEDDNNINIEEFIIHFNDTSLFIAKIPGQDILDHLYSILNAISENFIHFTKGLTEVPYEIFVPIFEEPIDAQKDIINFSKRKIRGSYLEYWGLYFYSEKNYNCLVFDVKNKAIINGDFYILNKD